jgi:hypothetical protein
MVPNEDFKGIGNNVTCKINAGMIMGSLFLSLSNTIGLCFYYLKMVKDHIMSERQFKNKLEKKLHIAALIFTISMVAILIIALVNTSPQGPNMCSTSPGKNMKNKIVPGLLGCCFVPGRAGPRT